jgi:hypothetical protein
MGRWGRLIVESWGPALAGSPVALRRHHPGLVRRPAPPAGKSVLARTLSHAPRVVPCSNACHRGLHRHCWFIRHGSRRTNSRREIAPPDFRLRGKAAGSERPPDEAKVAAAGTRRACRIVRCR